MRGFSGLAKLTLASQWSERWLHPLHWAQPENGNFVLARVSVGVSLPKTCLSSPCVSCNLPDTRKAPSDSPLLGPLDSPGWGWIFISSTERVCMHVHLHVFVWWVCNLSDTSWPRGRDTREMMDNNSAFTGQREQPGVTGWQQGLIHLQLLVG